MRCDAGYGSALDLRSFYKVAFKTIICGTWVRARSKIRSLALLCACNAVKLRVISSITLECVARGALRGLYLVVATSRAAVEVLLLLLQKLTQQHEWLLYFSCLCLKACSIARSKRGPLTSGSRH